jgi:hypothetical protein
MKLPRVVVYERNGRLAQLLAEPVQSRRWALREPRLVETCLRELCEGGPTVLVLQLTTKLEQELSILERVHWLFPDVRMVVLGDVENEALANLAWDLGASYVQLPSLPREQLPDIVIGLMASLVIKQSYQVHGLEPGEPAEAPSPPAKPERKSATENRHE